MEASLTGRLMEEDWTPHAEVLEQLPRSIAALIVTRYLAQASTTGTYWKNMSGHLEDLRKRLIGTWRNVSTTAELANDPASRQDLYGDDVNGFLMFSEDGYMLTLTTKANGDDPRAYAASFSLVEEEGVGPVLLHHAKAANEIQQPWVGTDQVRYPKLTVEDGVECLNLTARIALKEGGEERLVVVKWKRVERHDPLAKQTAP